MPELVVGIGARPGVAADDLLGAVAEFLGDAVPAVFATIDRRAGEPGLAEAAERLGVEVVAFTAIRLAAVPVPHPSDSTARALGTPSVAEAAALLASGAGELVREKCVVRGIVLAAARKV